MDIIQDIKNVKNLVDNVVNQYIVRPTGGLDSSGINGFVFDILDNEEMILDSDITDHYVEANYAIEDHIARRAEHFTLRGYVGEVSNIFSKSFLNILTNIQSLSSIGGFLPEYATQATEVYSKVQDVASKVGSVLNQAQNVYDMFTNSSTTATKQQNAYNYFYNMWLSRTLCTVETPFGILTDMAIENLRALQKGDTKFISDFSITFKKIRITNTTSFGPVLENTLANTSSGRLADMLSSIKNNGSTTGITKDSNGNLVNVSQLQGAFNQWQNNQLS